MHQHFFSNKQMMQKMRLFGWRSSSAFQKGSPMISQQFTLPYSHLEIGIM